MTDNSQDRPPLMEVVGLTKRFGAVTALSEVTFQVAAGEVHALLGDNGAGKSTLIQILNGVIQPTSGELRWEGKPVSMRSSRDAMALGISVVFQDLAIVPDLSITRNLFLGRESLISRKIGPFSVLNMAAANSKARQALQDVGIVIRNPDQSALKLSGGERQSIAIARAVYFESRLLIMDEPTSALSLKETAKVLTYIQQARDKGVAVVVITHNLHSIYPLADRFTVMSHGKSLGTFGKEAVTTEQLSEMIYG
jgi:simple sugar transport system ATP-binding protein